MQLRNLVEEEIEEETKEIKEEIKKSKEVAGLDNAIRKGASSEGWNKNEDPTDDINPALEKLLASLKMTKELEAALTRFGKRQGLNGPELEKFVEEGCKEAMQKLRES